MEMTRPRHGFMFIKISGHACMCSIPAIPYCVTKRVYGVER